MARKPLVLRDRVTKVLIPYYVKGEDVLLNDGTYLEAKLADIIGMIGQGGYTPPPTGIPADDLAGNIPLSKLSDTVQRLLALANTALQEQTQADWDEENSSSPAFIQHKPEIPEGVEVAQSVQPNDTRAVAGGAVYNELQGKASATTVALLRESLDAITGGDTTTAIRTFNEVVTFLANIEDTETLEGIIAGLQTEINKKYTKPQAGIPASDLEGNIPAGKLSQDVQTSLGKANTALQQSDKTSLQGAIDAVQTALNNLIGSGNAQGAIDTFNEVKAFLAGINTSDPTLYNTLHGLQTSINGKLGESDVSVSVPSSPDGTFVIHVGSTDYTINLNHTHDGMAKLVVDTAANLPDASEMESDTIYGELDDGEIATIYLGGYPFYGGGGGGVQTPVLRNPEDNGTINLDDTLGLVNIKGRHLTGGLTIQISGTDYTFDNAQPAGVTVDSTTQLTIASATTANAGVDISVVYSGSVRNAQATLTINSATGSPDNINVETTLVANTANRYLIAEWDGADAPVNGNWVDKKNSLPIILYGTAAKVSGGYQFNNLSNQVAASAALNSSANTFLNQQIDKEFTCIVNCLVKFDAADKKAIVIDFGGFGDSESGLSINTTIIQDGILQNTFKKNGNNSLGIVKQQSGSVFTIGDYTEITVKVGARLLQNGKQELYSMCGNAVNTKTIDTPVSVGFAGTLQYAGAFSLGIYYLKDTQGIDNLAPNHKGDVIIKSIKIYKSEV